MTTKTMKNQTDKLFDLEELLNIAAGDDVFIAEMISLFISLNETALLEIRNQIVTRDYSKIKAILHKMKPSVIVMGVSSLIEIIEQVEQTELSAMKEPVFSILMLKLEKTLQEVNEQWRLL